jgi:membrane protein YdbS with pleckstrin-like domain
MGRWEDRRPFCTEAAMIEFLGVVTAAMLGFVGLFLSVIAGVIWFALAAISGVFMVGALFSFAMWAFTGQHAAFLSMLDFLLWGGLSCVPMVLINYYVDKLVNPAPKKLRDGRYELARVPAHR